MFVLVTAGEPCSGSRSGVCGQERFREASQECRSTGFDLLACLGDLARLG